MTKNYINRSEEKPKIAVPEKKVKSKSENNTREVWFQVKKLNWGRKSKTRCKQEEIWSGDVSERTQARVGREKDVSDEGQWWIGNISFLLWALITNHSQRFVNHQAHRPRLALCWLLSFHCDRNVICDNYFHTLEPIFSTVVLLCLLCVSQLTLGKILSLICALLFANC